MTDDDPRLHDAALWFSQIDSGTVDTTAFAKWREADPRNAVAYAQIAALWENLDTKNKPAPAAEPDEVTASRWRPTRRAALGGIAAIATLGGGFFATRTFARESASTNVGERRMVQLPDNAGQVTLNTDSRIYWRGSEEGCTLWLDRGEVALDVPQRAPVVNLRGGDGKAMLGVGRYNVRLVGDLLDLTVIKGVATVPGDSGSHRQAATPASLHIEPLHRALLGGHAAPGPVSSDALAKMLAWPKGEILFTDEPLAIAVEEYNRHLTHRMVILDPAIARIRIGGRFTSSRPDAFLEALQASFGIRATQDGNTIVLTSDK